MNRSYKRYFILQIVMLLAALYSGSVHAAIHIDNEALNHSITTQTPSDYLEKIYQAQLDNGVQNFIPLSLLLISTSKQLIADGDPAKAAICAEYARRVSPDFPAAVMHEHFISWQSNRLMLHRLFMGYVIGLQRKFYTLDDFAIFAFIQLAVFGAALMLTIAGIALLSLVRNSRLLLHDMRHVLPKVFPAHTAIALLVLLCLFPLLLGLSFAWLFPYWLMLFWVYHNVKERAFIGILVVVFVFLVPLISVGCSFFLFIPQSDTVQNLWQANYGYYTKNDVDSFEQAVVLNPDDYELLFSAGLVNKRERNYTTALSYYNRLLSKKPRDFRVSTNIGNVYFAMGEWDQAVEKYEAAIASAPDRCAAAYFNLTRAYQQKFMFKEAERCLIEAKRLDSDRVEIYLDMYSENYNRLLIDETIPRKDLWLKGLNEFLRMPQLLNGIWDLVFAGLRLPFGTLAFLALLLLNIGFGDRDSLRVAAKCTLCGTIMCLRCQRNIDADSLCLKCQDFLKKQNQLSYKQKDVKKTQICEYVRSLRRWISLFSICMPGMAHVLKGSVIHGAVLSFLFFWLFFQAIFVFSFKGPWSDLGYDRIGVVGVCTFLVVILWFLSRAHVRTVRSAEIEDNVVLSSLGLDS